LTFQPGVGLATGMPNGVGHFQKRSLTFRDEDSLEIAEMDTLTDTIEHLK
jgi:hypothetical protein